ncbi:MAG: hypothetical protein L3K26_11170 [Candidatus Hydrogenedentes bacterium]|nr:hypothetical protein [Candidatus Hydrogenedentota bacterium]
MKKLSIHLIFSMALVLSLGLALAPSTWAQGMMNPFDINADVDNDGVVGPTDIQHVINNALGLNDRGPDAVDRPLRHYIVASPRASLSLLPGTGPDSTEACTTVGAATNFARRHGRLLVRKNTGIAFRFDRNVEGVWHRDACGLLRSELIVEGIRLPEPVEGVDPANAPELLAGDELDWVLIGRDGAEGRTCGPAIGTANVAVRHLFADAGDFVVRCTIRTFAVPQGEIVVDGEAPEFCGAARAVSRVFTHVRVVDHRADDADLQWQTDNDPTALGNDFGIRLENEPDSTIALP